MEQYGNEHFNMERVLRENISDNEYMRRTARPMATMKEVTDEVYSVVDHVEPWMSGNLRGPSTAFCLLYRLFELKPTVKEIQDALGSRDSPFIRAVRARLLYTAPVSVPLCTLSSSRLQRAATCVRTRTMRLCQRLCSVPTVVLTRALTRGVDA